MKLSVSMSDDDVDFLDRYAHEHGVDSRSAVVQRAVSLLRVTELGEEYAAAWSGWDASEAETWDVTAGDGLSSERR